jgi:hypothetical protein
VDYNDLQSPVFLIDLGADLADLYLQSSEFLLVDSAEILFFADALVGVELFSFFLHGGSSCCRRRFRHRAEV